MRRKFLPKYGGIIKDKGNILFKSNSVTFLYIFVSCVKPFNTTFYSYNVLKLFSIILNYYFI